jgi:phosphonopyruvate decarboxylase
LIEPSELFQSLVTAGIGLFAGVPDSLLKDFCAFLADHAAPSRHVIPANEGAAVALAMGDYLATGRPALVYLQNSGLGNAVNPLTSLADAAVYGIPMVLLVGWRGEPGVRDEPQHVKMGAVTTGLLEAIGVPFALLPIEPEAALALVADTVAEAVRARAPRALLVRKGTLARYRWSAPARPGFELGREQVVEQVVRHLPAGAVVVATTGMIGRELFEVRERRGQAHEADLLTVGGMGHASQIALGIALAQPRRPVYCLDGDGAALMHLGALATIGALAPASYRHLVLNNAAHDSVGGQPTVAADIDLCAVARACRYRQARCVADPVTLAAALAALATEPGPALVEVRVRLGARPDLGRPTASPAALSAELRAYLSAARHESGAADRA